MATKSQVDITTEDSMGTNFYWIDRLHECGDDMNIRVHIGKRSAAGKYCWDCGTTFCLGGTSDVHYSERRTLGGYVRWGNECPCCGADKSDDIGTSAAGVELGFEKPKKSIKSGIGSCCSFSWTLMSHKWRLQSMICDERKVVENEYGDTFTASEFLNDQLDHVAIEIQSPYEFC